MTKNQVSKPFFVAPIEQSFPSNSSPYLISAARFFDRFGGTAHRKTLLRSLHAFVEHVETSGVHVVGLLVGGSFCELNQEPRDLDGLLLIEFANSRHLIGNMILDWRREAEACHLDLRFAPTDIDPLWLVKISCFMSGLFSCSRQLTCTAKGSWLVDFRTHPAKRSGET